MMRWTHKFPLRLRSLFRKGRMEKELSEDRSLNEVTLVTGLSSLFGVLAMLCSPPSAFTELCPTEWQGRRMILAFGWRWEHGEATCWP